MVVKLKANVSTLESQVDSLKADLTEVRRSQSLSSADRDSMPRFEQNSQITSQPADGPDRCHDPQFSFSYVYRRNKTKDWVPIVSLADTADDEVSQETHVQQESTGRSVFKSPERRCFHSCSVAAHKGKPEEHCVHIHTSNGVAGVVIDEGSVTSNGETMSEGTDRLSSDADVLNDTLSDLVESNSDTSGRVLNVKVSTTVRCRKHIDVSKSDAVKRSDGSASASDELRPSRNRASCSTQTNSAEYIDSRYVVTNHISHRCIETFVYDCRVQCCLT